MAWRFRRSTKVGPFRFTATKRGFSTSVGVRGARIGLNSKGQVRATGGIPGTGVYDTEIIGHVGGTTPAQSEGVYQQVAHTPNATPEPVPAGRRRGLSGKGVVILIMGVVIAWLVVVLIMR